MRVSGSPMIQVAARVAGASWRAQHIAWFDSASANPFTIWNVVYPLPVRDVIDGARPAAMGKQTVRPVLFGYEAVGTGEPGLAQSPLWLDTAKELHPSPCPSWSVSQVSRVCGQSNELLLSLSPARAPAILTTLVVGQHKEMECGWSPVGQAMVVCVRSKAQR